MSPKIRELPKLNRTVTPSIKKIFIVLIFWIKVFLLNLEINEKKHAPKLKDYSLGKTSVDTERLKTT